MKSVQKILSGRRISLPSKWMEENNLSIGGWVLIRVTERGIEIVPAMVVER